MRQNPFQLHSLIHNNLLLAVALTVAPSSASAISVEALEKLIKEVKASEVATRERSNLNTTLINKAENNINLNKKNIKINKQGIEVFRKTLDKSSGDIETAQKTVQGLKVTHDSNNKGIIGQITLYTDKVTKIKETILPEEVAAIGTLSLRRCAGTHQVTWNKCVYKLGGKGPKGGIIFKIGHQGNHGSEVTPEDVITAPFGCLNVNFNGELKEYIGSGKDNTDVILNKKCTGSLAAGVTTSFKLKGQGGWYLPSVYELRIIRNALRTLGLGDFNNNEYWSSSDNGGNNVAAYTFDFENNYKIARERSSLHSIRLVSDF